MKFRHLNIFKCVCEEMNMTKASKLLYMSQPSVSQAIHELEDKYQCKLFERLSHKLYLTESGELLYKYAKHIIALNVELESVMKPAPTVQKIKVGATVTIGTYCLGELISGFMDKTAYAEIIINIKNTKDIEKSILNSTIDLALVEGSIDSKDIIVTSFMKDELVIIGSKEHTLSKKKIVRIEDLNAERFLIREDGSGSRQMFLELVNQNNISIQVAGELNNNEAIKNAVKSGLGLGVVSRASISTHDDFIELEIEQMKMMREFSLIYHKNKFLNKRILAFIDYILGLSE